MLGQKNPNNRGITWRQKHQNSRLAQRKNKRLNCLRALSLPLRMCLLTGLTVAIKFILSVILTGLPFAFRTKLISKWNTNSMPNHTCNATSSRDFFSELRITVTLLFASISWLTVFLTSFYLPPLLLRAQTHRRARFYRQSQRRQTFGWSRRRLRSCNRSRRHGLFQQRKTVTRLCRNTESIGSCRFAFQRVGIRLLLLRARFDWFTLNWTFETTACEGGQNDSRQLRLSLSVTQCVSRRGITNSRYVSG